MQPSVVPPDRVLYVVATVHLDTQWRWTVQDTIREYLPATLEGNFAHLERHPWFVVSFEGAFRYRLIEVYYPEQFQRLSEWVRQGRWRPAGGMLDAPDVNLPSPESLLRHILYGQRYFRDRFGVESSDVFLPDCFGFGWALPTIAAHCGLRSFSSSKFDKWMAPGEVPFELGLWEGPDGAALVAALHPEGYGEGLGEDLSRAERFVERLDALWRATGVAVGLKYVGLGDRGGALDAEAMRWLELSLAGGGPIRVLLAGPERLARDLPQRQAASLPRHRGELLLPTHGTGCWTSQVAAKRWNRRCERLADAAERAAVAAHWLGALPYPTAALRAAWERFLWHQMHDDLTGTSIPEAYRFTWNDQLLALNAFGSLLTDAVAGVASGLDTAGGGVPVVVFNPLGWPRREVLEVSAATSNARLRVLTPEGVEQAVQVLGRDGERVRLLFVAELPAHGFGVYRIVEGAAALPPSTVSGGVNWLENDRYRVEFDTAGRPTRLRDREFGRELVAGPVELQLLPDESARWPAWEIRGEDLLPGKERPLDGSAEIHLAEPGPLRAVLEVRRRDSDSSFVQRFALTAGGEWMEIETRVDWRTRSALLKLAFPLAVAADQATYDLGCGAAERGVNSPVRYEVPAQQWADLSDSDGGVSVLSASTYGWDRPAPHVLRSSLVRSPAAGRKFRHQADQDHGEHSFRHALLGHAGDWRDGGTVAAAARFEQPTLAFLATPHPGPLGRRFALLGVGSEAVAVRALKKAEDDAALIVRLQETRGRTARGVRLALPTSFVAARVTDGRERPHLEVPPRDGDLQLDFLPFELRTLALTPEPTRHPLPPPVGRPLALAFDRQATSFHGDRPVDFDGQGRSFPGELWPATVEVGGVAAPLGPAAPGTANALACAGQELGWEEPAERLVLLVASVAGAREVELTLASRRERLRVPDWTGPIGRYKGWQAGLTGQRWAAPETGYLERTTVAWIAGHRHDGRLRDEPYEQAYLFRLELDLEAGDWSLRLPDDPAIRLFAAVLLTESHPRLTPAGLLY